MKKWIGLFSFLMIGFASQAKAVSFLVEPYLGVHLMGGGDGVINGLNYDNEFSGTGYGARLGITQLGLMLGLDYSLSSGDNSYEATTTGAAAIGDDEFDRTNIGLFVGYDFITMFRFWATYYFSANIEDGNGSDAGDEYDGNGYGLGIGYTGLPIVSINLEYQTFEYDEFFDASAGSTATLNNKPSSNNIFLSISAPFEL